LRILINPKKHGAARDDDDVNLCIRMRRGKCTF